ncbi:MAG: hypothetical protein V2I66_02710 [Halieaceae bacterium]|jgi:hypothetical protein|nr:hypothetical protein [Halieaceae bacterium]
MNLRKPLLLMLGLQLVACTSLIQSTSLTDAYKMYERGDYERTLALIARAETVTEPTPDMLAELTYLKAQTHERLGHAATAQSLYSYLAEQHSQTQYGYLASQRLSEGP